MSITKTLRKNTSRFGVSTTLLHGEYGVGKTLLAAQYEKPYFLMFENNDVYEDIIYFDNISNWVDCVAKIQEFLNGDHDFKTLVLDNIDIFYNLAKQHFINDFNENIKEKDKPDIISLSDIGFAKGYDAVDDMIKIVLNPVDMDSNFNFILIAHTEAHDVETFSGETFCKLIPELPGKRPKKYFFTLAQNIFYYYFSGKDRYLKIVGDDFVLAKNKGNKHFLTDKGEQIINIPMKNNPETAFKYLNAAYNNKLKNTYKQIK